MFKKITFELLGQHFAAKKNTIYVCFVLNCNVTKIHGSDLKCTSFEIFLPVSINFHTKQRINKGAARGQFPPLNPDVRDSKKNI